MVPLNEHLVEDWLLREMAAEGLIRHENGRYVFQGDKNLFEITLTARAIGGYTTRLAEPAPDFGKDYRGYN